MNSEEIKDARAALKDASAALNAASSQLDSAATGALLGCRRYELDALARRLGIENPGYMNKPELVERIKAKL